MIRSRGRCPGRQGPIEWGVHDERPRVGISSCLLGQPVRYDGGHKRDPFLVETFGAYVEWVPVCPELEAGFGLPRPSMSLYLVDAATRERGGRFPADAIGVRLNKDGTDVTQRLRHYSRKRAEQLADSGLSGYVLKKDSPSCGMERVKVYTTGMPERGGRGVFAEALMARLPNLPVEEEGRLGDPRLRENFIERIFAYGRLQGLFGRRWSVGDVVAFHTSHKLTLMAHSPAAYRALGRLVASAKQLGRGEFSAAYQSQFMQALTTMATPKKHANVLQHMLGYFSDAIDADARAEFVSVIDEYRLGRIPLIVPITLFRHYVRRLKVTYLLSQTYLEPHPRELSLRNHV